MNNNKYFPYFSRLLVVLACSSSVIALENIIINEGECCGLPITIATFNGAAGNISVAPVIRNDLFNSGQFVSPSVGKSLYRLSGNIRYVNNTYKVTAMLHDLDGSQSKEIFQLNFTAADPKKLRLVAHKISDAVFAKIIGRSGIFSTKIAYVAKIKDSKGKLKYSLQIADLDGFNSKNVVQSAMPIMSPSWSPTGEHIAYVSFPKNRSAINIVELASGKVTLLSQYKGINSAPSWSPNGKKMALVLSKDGSPSIYVMDLPSRKLERVTFGASIDTEPQWTSTGTELIFTSDRSGSPQIYMLNMQLKTTKRLTNTGAYNARGSIAHDASKLVFLHRDKRGAFKVAVQDLRNNTMQLISAGSLDNSPSLAANDMMVVYSSVDQDRTFLVASTIDGRVKTRLPLRFFSVQEPAWSRILP